MRLFDFIHYDINDPRANGNNFLFTPHGRPVLHCIPLMRFHKHGRNGFAANVVNMDGRHDAIYLFHQFFLCFGWRHLYVVVCDSHIHHINSARDGLGMV